MELLLIRANKKVPAIIAIEAMVAIIKNSLSKPLKLRELDIDVATDLLVPVTGLAAELPVVGLAVAGLLVAMAGFRASHAERRRCAAGFVGGARSGGSGPASRVVR